jgi:hypothetical protein
MIYNEEAREGKDAHSPRPSLPFTLVKDIISNETWNENMNMFIN